MAQYSVSVTRFDVHEPKETRETPILLREYSGFPTREKAVAKADQIGQGLSAAGLVGLAGRRYIDDPDEHTFTLWVVVEKRH